MSGDFRWPHLEALMRGPGRIGVGRAAAADHGAAGSRGARRGRLGPRRDSLAGTVLGAATLCLGLLGLLMAGPAALVAPAAAAGCPNEALRQGPSALLPECRAYEMVSPPDKANSDVEDRFNFPSIGVAGTEDSYAFASVNALPGSENGGINVGNVARRGPTGWTTSFVMPPELNQGSAVTGLPLLLSRNLNQAIVQTRVPLTAGAQPGNNLYLRTISPPSVRLITPISWPSITNWYPSEFIGASEDFSSVIFQAPARLTPDSSELSGGSQNLYEWNGSTLTNVGILPGETEPDRTGVVGRAVSADGLRVVFTAGGQVYVREHGTTVEASKPAPGVTEPGTGTTEYVGASKDLSSVFFISTLNLTTDAFTGENSSGEKNLAPNLYRYDVETGELTDLTVDRADEGGAEIMSASPLVAQGGDVVFFAAGGVLASGATPGTPNLYRWSAAGGIEFVAANAWTSSTGRRDMVTDDTGEALAFTSDSALTNEAPVGVNEIYRWSTSEGLTCVSCAPVASPKGAELWTWETRLNGGLRGHPMSADGSRIFFTTTDRLVPQDTNGKPDVYEWVAGAVHLISTGSGEYGAEFSDATPSGSDVFFVTRNRLVGADRDENTDVYDARVDGGFPEPAVPVSCEAEACLPPLEAAPPALQIGSRSFDGPANPTRHHRHKAHRKARKHHKQGARACKAKTKRCPRASLHGGTTGKRG